MSDDLKLVKELRDKTGAGFLDCKEALANNEGNIDKISNQPADTLSQSCYGEAASLGKGRGGDGALEPWRRSCG